MQGPSIQQAHRILKTLGGSPEHWHRHLHKADALNVNVDLGTATSVGGSATYVAMSTVHSMAGTEWQHLRSVQSNAGRQQLRAEMADARTGLWGRQIGCDLGQAC